MRINHASITVQRVSVSPIRTARNQYRVALVRDISDTVWIQANALNLATMLRWCEEAHASFNGFNYEVAFPIGDTTIYAHMGSKVLADLVEALAKAIEQDDVLSTWGQVTA